MISDHTLLRVFRSERVVAVIGDAARVALGVLVAGIVTLCLLVYAILTRHMFVEWHMNDFGKFYYSAKAFLDGGDMYGPTPATAIPVSETETRQFWNMNPPHFHVLILPLALLRPLYAYLFWSVASIAALVVSFRLIARELALKWSLSAVIWTIVGLLICSATGTLVVTGQLTFLFLLPLTLAWIEARHDRWNRAAAYLGAAASVKPFLAIFWIYLLLKRRFKSATVMAATAVACLLVGLLVFGWQSHLAWLGSLSGVAWTWAPMNGSIAGLLARALEESPYFVPLADAPEAVGPLSALLALPVGAWSLWALSRDGSNQAVDRVFAGLLLTAQLVSPLGWVYYLWLVAPPAVALWLTRRSRPSRLRDWFIVLAVPGLIFPLYMTLEWWRQWWGGITIGSIYTWTTLALWASVMVDWKVREPRRQSRTQPA